MTEKFLISYTPLLPAPVPVTWAHFLLLLFALFFTKLSTNRLPSGLDSEGKVARPFALRLQVLSRH